MYLTNTTANNFAKAAKTRPGPPPPLPRRCQLVPRTIRTRRRVQNSALKTAITPAAQNISNQYKLNSPNALSAALSVMFIGEMSKKPVSAYNATISSLVRSFIALLRQCCAYIAQRVAIYDSAYQAPIGAESGLSPSPSPPVGLVVLLS